MGIDIQYLLFWQSLREATGGILDEFFNAISKFAVDLLIFLPFIIFWCVDKKWGYRFIITHRLGEVINGIIKLTVCAYRPWIRSELIDPAGDSKVAATGYSFPSGHTMCATTIYGTVAVWMHKKRRWIAVLCVVLIALTAFSRNFLGVHTPQDVLVGLGESILIIFVVGFLAKKFEGKEKTLDILTIVGAFAVIGVLFYIMLKPYPMDYVNGELLVDPQKMMNDSFKACGGMMGFLVGSFIERHLIRYEIPKNSKNLALLGFLGFMIVFSWIEWFAPATFVAAFGDHWGNYIAQGLMFIFILVIWPLVIRKYTVTKE